MSGARTVSAAAIPDLYQDFKDKDRRIKMFEPDGIIARGENTPQNGWTVVVKGIVWMVAFLTPALLATTALSDMTTTMNKDGAFDAVVAASPPPAGNATGTSTEVAAEWMWPEPSSRAKHMA